MRYDVHPWAWHSHPQVWLIMGGALVLYFLALRRLGPQLVDEGQPVARRSQVAFFVAGVALLWISSDYPVHDLAEKYLYWVHMIQHMLITLAAPPLLLLGTPQWLQRWILRNPVMDFVARRLCRPLAAGVIFAAATAISHAPFWVNGTLEHHELHFFAHVLMFVTAMIMWFPVTNSMPEYPTMAPPVKMAYLFLQSIIPNVPVAFLTFADGVVYKYYAHVPRPFSMNAIEDQQLAGAVMKISGTLILWSVIIGVFFTWFRDEHGPVNAPPPRRVRPLPEVLTWDDVERELSRPPQPSH